MYIKNGVPIISVIMPTLGTKNLDGPLASLKAQTFKDWEFICIVDKDRKGAPWARNEGIKQAHGRFYFFMDDDLILEPSALGTLLENIGKADFCYGWWTRGDVIMSRKTIFKDQLYRTNWITGCALFKAETFPGWDEEIERLQDWDVYLTLFDQGYQGVYVDKKIFSTPEEEGISSRGAEDYTKWWSIVRAKHNRFKIAVLSLTRDRLEYTKKCFASLKKNAGIDYDHYVLDNGSQDGTAEWLYEQQKKGNIHTIFPQPGNIGISEGFNTMLDYLDEKYDLIVRFDNDCEVVTPNTLRDIAGIYYNHPEMAQVVLSPRVEGLNFPPQRYAKAKIDGFELGFTHIVGGIFQVIAGPIFTQFRFDEKLPKAYGQDQQFASWFQSKGGKFAYVEDLVVNHFETTNGQTERYPEYFERKYKEEKK